MKFIKSFGGREKYKSCKLKKDRTSDCVVRAIAHALEQDYNETFQDLLKLSSELLEMPNSRKCFELYLEEKGWIKNKPMRNSKKRKLRVFEYPKNGTYIVHTSKHLTCVKDGVLLDTWNCQKWCANSYYTNNN